jgi:hypothetical protein
METTNRWSELARRMSDLRSTKPRPLQKMFGSNGPTPSQLQQWKADMSAWNKKFGVLAKELKAIMASGTSGPPAGTPYVMTPARKAALKKAQDISADKRRGHSQPAHLRINLLK